MLNTFLIILMALYIGYPAFEAMEQAQNREISIKEARDHCFRSAFWLLVLLGIINY